MPSVQSFRIAPTEEFLADQRNRSAPYGLITDHEPGRPPPLEVKSLLDIDLDLSYKADGLYVACVTTFPDDDSNATEGDNVVEERNCPDIYHAHPSTTDTRT